MGRMHRMHVWVHEHIGMLTSAMHAKVGNTEDAGAHHSNI